MLQGMEVYSTVLWHLKAESELSHLAQEGVAWDRRSPHAWAIMGNCFSLQKVPFLSWASCTGVERHVAPCLSDSEQVLCPAEGALAENALDLWSLITNFGASIAENPPLTTVHGAGTWGGAAIVSEGGAAGCRLRVCIQPVGA